MGALIHPAQLLQPQLPRAASSSSKLKDSLCSSPCSTQPCWSSPIPRLHSRRHLAKATKKKQGWFDDPFNYGEDEEQDGEEEFGQLLSRGVQDARDPIPDRDEDSAMGFLDFPAGYMPEIASLGTLIRNDVRRCLCIVSGGVYENLLFFPVIQLLKNRYPGVKIDIMAGARGKQVIPPLPLSLSLSHTPHLHALISFAIQWLLRSSSH